MWATEAEGYVGPSYVPVVKQKFTAYSSHSPTSSIHTHICQQHWPKRWWQAGDHGMAQLTPWQEHVPAQ